MSRKLPTVALIGRTNAGKSSLFNRIYGAQEAIVAREAGTTRDNVVRTVHTHGRDFWLVDTAGMKTAEDDFEATIQEQIEDATELADVIVVVVDSTEFPSDEERRVAKIALKSQKPVILAVNKSDLKNSLEQSEFRRLGIKAIVSTSAEHNRGVGELIKTIVTELPEHTDKAECEDDKLKIALIGRPNVGKSSLFNSLAGKQQAIVASVVGTTRDVNRTDVRYKGQTLELLDTAGVRKPGKREQGIEKFSVLRTLSAIEESDICLLLMDANEYNTALDQKLAGMIKDAGKGLIIVITKWDAVGDKDEFTRDALAPRIARQFDFVPWAPLIFTSAVTGQNVTKIFTLAQEIMERRTQKTTTRKLNDMLQTAIAKHPPAGLKNTRPKLRYIVQTDTTPPWFVIYGSNLKLIHWSYERYLERILRETYDYSGTPIKFSFRQEEKTSRPER